MKRSKLSKEKYTMYILTKGVPGSGIKLNLVFKEMNLIWFIYLLSFRLRNLIKGGQPQDKSYPAKFPTCEKELKECLEPGVVVHSFNPSTQKAEAGGSLSLKPSWSLEFRQ